MIWPDGTRDETTEVLWLQTSSLFADLRVPADRPAAGGRAGFAEFSDPELIALSRMQGFGGALDVDGSICRWAREFDYQPPGSPPDEANFAFDGDLLIETGLHAEYEEIWERRTDIGAELAAFRLAESKGDRGGILVLAGGFFLLIEDRAKGLPEAASLAALVERDLAAGDRGQAIERLDMRIAFGSIRPGWIVSAATLPWLEGASLFSGRRALFDAAAAMLEITDGATRQLWRLAETSMTPTDLAAYFRDDR